MGLWPRHPWGEVLPECGSNSSSRDLPCYRFTVTRKEDTADSRADSPNSDPAALEGTDSNKLEYIKALLVIARDDEVHVGLYVTVALAIASLFITQIPLESIQVLPLWTRIVLCTGLLSLACSALFFFRYIRGLHLTRMRIARCLPSLDVHRARELWAGSGGVWERYKSNYYAGQALLGIGIASVGVVILRLYLVVPS